MFRITIDNEEVLCDKDITIKEEMLNTPSVILNNVFPKSWEATKDYTTNFYHPDDYSKCIIADEDYIEQSDGTTVEGSNLSINYDDRRNFEYNLKGNTTQNGTPTPDTPVPIEVVTGQQDIQVCGKNWFNKNATPYETGKYISQDGSIVSNVEFSIYKIYLLENTKYTLKNNGSTYGPGLCFYNKNGVRLDGFGYANREAITFTTPTNTSYILMSAVTQVTSSRYDLDIMQLEKGTQATTYEAYKGNTYEINLGKQLFNFNDTKYYRSSTYNTVSKSGNTITYTNSSSGANGMVWWNIPVEVGKSITISYSSLTESTTNANNRVQYYFSDTIATSYESSGTNIDKTSKTSTATVTKPYLVLQLRSASGSNIENTLTDLQVEYGTVKSSYADYFTPIELCKIGNYRDYIKRSSGKNLWNYDFEIAEYNSSGIKTTTTVWLVNTTKIKVKPNTTYSVSQKEHPIQYRIICFNGSTYLSQLQNSVNTTTGYSNYTFTTPNNCDEIYIQFRSTTERMAQSGASVSLGDITNVMLNEGSTALPYEPYGTGWYVCKNIEKVVLNGSESGWTAFKGGVGDTYCYYKNYTTIAKDFTDKYCVCDYFTYNIGTSLIPANTFAVGGLTTAKNGNLIFNKGDTTSDLAGFKTWLSTHNTTVYYVLNTPTYIGIEDEELISQLESVRLLNGLNNITISSPYLPAIMNLHYNFNEAYYYMNQLFFSGVVKNSGNISLNPREPHFQTLQILDFKTFLSEGETLDRVIYNKTILETIQEVVGVISGYGFVLGNVQIANPNDVIGAYSTENKTAYDIFNYIAEITQSKWTTRLVDENTVAIDFYDPSALPQGTPIEYNTTYFKNNQIDNMFYSYSANDYRNKQIMTSKEVFANISTKETIISSGYGSNFLLEQPVGQVESITLNNVEMSFATKQDKELGYSADFYYSVGSNSIESDVNIPLGSSIVIQYIPIVSGRQVIANDNEISRISGATGRNGIITRYENRNDASTSTELQMIGQSYIKYKGSPEIKLTVETRSNLWKIGDRVQFNAPIPELATEYMVKSKKIQYIPTIDEIFYTFEMSSSFNSEQDINYFDNQRAKAQGNIKEGSYISRNIDIENVANITFQNVSIEKINSTGDNKLNSTLNSPIVQ